MNKIQQYPKHLRKDYLAKNRFAGKYNFGPLFAGLDEDNFGWLDSIVQVSETLAIGFEYWRADRDDEELQIPDPLFDKVRKRAGQDRILLIDLTTKTVVAELTGMEMSLRDGDMNVLESHEGGGNVRRFVRGLRYDTVMSIVYDSTLRGVEQRLRTAAEVWVKKHQYADRGFVEETVQFYAKHFANGSDDLMTYVNRLIMTLENQEGATEIEHTVANFLRQGKHDHLDIVKGHYEPVSVLLDAVLLQEDDSFTLFLLHEEDDSFTLLFGDTAKTGPLQVISFYVTGFASEQEALDFTNALKAKA
jgi:hypothetical protein